MAHKMLGVILSSAHLIVLMSLFLRSEKSFVAHLFGSPGSAH